MRKLLMVLLLIGLTLPALAEGPAYRVEGDALIYPPRWEDEDERQPLLLKPGAVSRLTGDESPWKLRDELSDELTGGLPCMDIALMPDSITLLLTLPDGRTRLRVAQWDAAAGAYRYVDNDTLPTAQVYLDDVHPAPGRINLSWTEPSGRYMWLEFCYVPPYRWCLAGVDAQEAEGEDTDFYRLGENFVETDGDEGPPSRRRVYGEHPWNDLRMMDLSAIPTSGAEAAKQVNREGWAVVNNPNPEDRLHLRTLPSKDAKTRGKFYNGTAVRILEQRGEWSKVLVGQDLMGWMMTRYLAVEEAGDSVACAWLSLVSVDLSKPTPVYAEPNKKTPPQEEILMDECSGWEVIGVYGDDWYLVLLDSGYVGYVPHELLKEGNG